MLRVPSVELLVKRVVSQLSDAPKRLQKVDRLQIVELLGVEQVEHKSDSGISRVSVLHEINSAAHYESI